ncbi:hypothetical protein SDRG_13858 [Saprolegnia diclina VS20]|uniref:Uncharacterized protein n=1 Tax=Saprolegnia diclina (strain VS20) TaxID=1156394 RepID=T0RFU0_SAPDV|nr:hypothetical protein SDRG_13858 [Saprolegnia diclina VS20]EQC28532.1 hypothetical protein SDRG_13858 [Saprolegnia diclina VS20]|eukprot:XP_008618180.1 hypothetical protein SDRG_13858 [Saprolegnia diclina VS20]
MLAEAIRDHEQNDTRAAETSLCAQDTHTRADQYVDTQKVLSKDPCTSNCAADADANAKDLLDKNEDANAVHRDATSAIARRRDPNNDHSDDFGVRDNATDDAGRDDPIHEATEVH